MSALAITLAVVMAVSSDTTEDARGEKEQKLDLGGDWCGYYRTKDIERSVLAVVDGTLSLYIPKTKKDADYSPFKAEDVGKHRLKLQLGKEEFLGIYRRKGNRIIICMRPAANGYPASFDDFQKGEYLLTIRRPDSDD